MKILWGLLLCLTLTSCVENSKKKEPTQETGNKGGQVIYLDANTPIEHDTLTLEEIADTVVYLRLDAKIREGAQINYLDSLVLVHDGTSLQAFKPTGERIYEIVSPGSLDMLPNAKSFYLYELKENSINQYDFQGKQLNTIHLTEVPKTFYGYNFLALSDSLFAFSHPNIGTNKYELFLVDSNGNAVWHKENVEPFVPKEGARLYDSYWRHTLFRTTEGCRYLRCFSDTLWTITANRELKPMLIETMIGKMAIEHRMEYNGMDNDTYIIETVNKEPEKKNGVRYFETSRFIIGEYKVGQHQRDWSDYICYDKHNKKWYQIINKFPSEGFLFHFGIFNNYDGGLAFAPSTQSGEWLIMVNASDQNGESRMKPKRLYQEGIIIQNRQTGEMEQYLYRSDVWKDAEKRNLLNKFYQDFNDDKHSVLMLVRLKK